MTFSKIKLIVSCIAVLGLSATVVVASGQVPTQWQVTDPVGMSYYNDIAYGDGKLVLVGNRENPNSVLDVRYSSDDGSTWSDPVEVGTVSHNVGRAQVHRFHNRWVIAGSGKVWSSTDLTTWTEEPVTFSFGYQPGNGAVALTETVVGNDYRGVYVANTGFPVVETSPGNWQDAGQSSAIVANPGRSNMTAVGDSLYFVTALNNRIYKSGDGGTTWTSAAINVATDMTDKKLYDITTIGDALWVTGSNGFIAKSTDGGSTWVEKNTPNASLADMWEMDGNSEVLIAMGHEGGSTRAVYSNDEGETWQAMPDDAGLFGLAAWVGVAASPTGMVGTSTTSSLMVGVLPTATTTTTVAPTTTTVAPTTVPSGIGGDEIAHLAADGTFAHADLNSCQYVGADGVVSDTEAVVDLENETISCGAENDLEIDLAGNEDDATTALNGQLIFFVEKEGVANGYGFKPGSTAEVWLASEPRLLGTVQVQEDGTWEKVFDVPSDLDDGEHTIQAEGIGYDGSDQAVNAGVMIQRSAPELPATGNGSAPWQLAVVMLLTGGAVLVTRRRLID